MHNSSLRSYRLEVASRVLAALVGGYIWINLAGLTLTYLLPVDQYKGLLTGLMLSFVFYTLIVIWVFSVRSSARAWAGLIVTALPLALINIIFSLK